MVGIQKPDALVYDLVIIGAGLEALHVVSRLPENLLKGTSVVDENGKWLESWWDRCQRLGVRHLRTPTTVHPHPSPLELRTFVEKRGLAEELLPGTLPGSAPLPTAELLRDFCISRIVNKLPDSVRSIMKDTATSISPPPSDAIAGAPTQSASSLVEVSLASGRVLHARAVVVAASRRRPVAPVWAEQVRAATEMSDHRNGKTPQPSVMTWDQVDLNSAHVEGKGIVVVGGGMTAASLALGAIARGAGKVTVLSRRALVWQAYECEVGWWGNKRLNEFSHLNDPGERLKACRRALQQGSVNAPLWEKLVAAALEGKLAVLENIEVQSCQHTGCKDASEGGRGLSCSALELRLQEPRDLYTAAGGTAPQPTAFQQALAAAAAASGGSSPLDTSAGSGGACDTGANGGATAAGRTAASPAVDAVTATSAAPDTVLHADAVWLACGAAFNAGTDPLLQPLRSATCTRLVGGYPVLDPGSCGWPGAPVYFIGRAALLAVGPCAGDLAGMRLAAGRIVASLKKIDYAGEPEWASAAVTLLKAAPKDWPGCTKSAAVQGAVACAAHLSGGTDDQEEEPALEEEGRPWIERRPTLKPISRAANLVDIADLPPDLPRREVQRYTVSESEDGFRLTVSFQLEGEDGHLTQDALRSLITERTLEVWAVGSRAAHRLYVPRLYGKVLPQRCSVRLSNASPRVRVVLLKESDAEWRFLKG